MGINIIFMNLYIYLETMCYGFKPSVLDVLAFISIIFGIYTIISKNPIVSVLFLIALS